MASILTHSFSTPVGELILGSLDDALCLCDWRYRNMRDRVDARVQQHLHATYEEGMSPVIEEAMEQLAAYFAGSRTSFDLPLRLAGTDFQQRVWEALRAIPFGTTTTYASLTEQVAERTAIRAVASANGANAISIIIPCHRVVGSTGELVGYAGGLPAKKRLLQLEGASDVAPDLFSEMQDAIG